MPFVLPPAPSWFPGHMKKFLRILPSLLARTDVVIEIRDSRLPLTSINRNLEGLLTRWKMERGWIMAGEPYRAFNSIPCEHLVILNKKDLVPDWGIEAFSEAMNVKFPTQQSLFVSWQDPHAVRAIVRRLVSVARAYPHAPEVNVLVLGMPNVGKSTLLNALRNQGIQGRTPKAFRTSAQPGLTQALSTRIRISEKPLVYAFDTPGVMVPFLGRGQEGSERGVKLSLIAGIKEGLYDLDTQAEYLLYRLNLLNPTSPAYLDLLDDTYNKPILDISGFLNAFARRRGMMKRGGEADVERAATTFIRWWREEGGSLDAASKLLSPRQTVDSLEHLQSVLNSQVSVCQGWGFDFQWSIPVEPFASRDDFQKWLQQRMMEAIDDHIAREQKIVESGELESDTQKRKKILAAQKMRRMSKFAQKGQPRSR